MFAGALFEEPRSTAAAAETDDHVFSRNLLFIGRPDSIEPDADKISAKAQSFFS